MILFSPTSVICISVHIDDLVYLLELVVGTEQRFNKVYVGCFWSLLFFSLFSS